MNEVGSMKKITITAISAIALLFMPDIVSAELVPEIQLGVRGVFSTEIKDTDTGSTTTLVDHSDTSVMLGFRQKMFSDYRGRLVIGQQFTDPGSGLGDVFYQHVFVELENRENSFMFGKSRADTSLIEFPTLRDDDALLYSQILNPFAQTAEIESEEHQFADVLKLSRLFDQKYRVKVYGAHFTEDPETEFDINGVGVVLDYSVPETQRWNRAVLDQIGFGYNVFLDVDNSISGGKETLSAAAFSIVLNIKPDPVHFWDLRHQTIYNLGLDNITTMNDMQDVTKARSVATMNSLRYLYRKYERPLAQISAAVGYRNFPDLTQDTDQLQYILSGSYRVGMGFDTGVQLLYQDFDGDLAALFGDNEFKVQAFLSFEFDVAWNNQFDDRDSLLNLEHRYIP